MSTNESNFINHSENEYVAKGGLPKPIDETPTEPSRPTDHRYNVIITAIEPARRINVINAMLKADKGGLTFMDAVTLVFQLPSVVMRNARLQEAVALELILETYGATVEIIPSRQRRSLNGTA